MTNRRGAAWMGPAGLIVAVFIAGAMTGAAGVRWFDHRPPSTPAGAEPDGQPSRGREDGRRGRSSSNRFLEEITERLHLSEQQRAQIDSIVEAQRRRSREVMESVRPELSAALDSMNAAIEATLDSKQRAEFEVILKDVRARSRGQGGPPSGAASSPARSGRDSTGGGRP